MNMNMKSNLNINSETKINPKKKLHEIIFGTSLRQNILVEEKKCEIKEVKYSQNKDKQEFQNSWYYVFVDDDNPTRYLKEKYNISVNYKHQISKKVFEIYLVNEVNELCQKTASNHFIKELTQDENIILQRIREEDKYVSPYFHTEKDENFKSFPNQIKNKRKSNLNKILLKRVETDLKYGIDLNDDNHNNYAHEKNENVKYYVYIDDNKVLKDSKYYQVVSNLTENIYLLEINRTFLIEGLEELCSSDYVLFITLYRKPTSKNAFSSGFTQKNTLETIRNEKSHFSYIDRYINKQGIRGQNEIISILDELIDIQHSMFYDPDHNFSFNTLLTDHRKFVYYNYQGDFDSYFNELEFGSHGTHCAGTICGNNNYTCNSEYDSTFNGIAPDAKLVYIGGFDTSYDIDAYIALMVTTNSLISSNSWGSTGFNVINNYLYGNSLIGLILFVCAAGNERQLFPQWEYFSVCDPGGSKNVLTVGALDSLINTYTQKFYLIDPSKILPDVELFVYSYKFIGNFDHFNFIVNNNIFILNLSDINIYDIQNGYHIIYYENTLDIDQSKLNGKIFFTNDPLIHQYNVDMKIVQLIADIQINKTFQYETGNYSSQGPAYNGVIKPDVVTPGTLITSSLGVSINTMHGCLSKPSYKFDTITMMGTSMATPNCAGAAALIHQYFKEKRNLELTGLQLRSLIIASANRHDGIKRPDLTSGHGAVDLSTILYFEENPNKFGVAITNITDIIDGISHFISSISVKNKDIPLRIVLSYPDIQYNIDSIIPIIYDLDLVLISPSGKTYYGNHRTDNDEEHLSTNEKIIVNEDEIEIGEYFIHIYSNMDIQQLFSVVAVGPIEDGILEFTKTQECGCAQCDEYGKCLCDSTHVGNRCQTTIININEEEEEITTNIEYSSIKRIKIEHHNIAALIVTRPDSVNGSYSSLWHSKTCHSTLNDYDLGIKLEEITTVIPIYSEEPICIAIFNNHFNSQTFQIKIESSDNENGNDSPINDDNNNNELSKYKLILIITTSVLGFIVIVLIIIIILRSCKIKMNNLNNEEYPI